MDNSEDLGNRSALLGELAIDRGVAALDALAHAQELSVVAHARNFQVGLPSTYIDYLFKLVGGAGRT